MRLDWEDIKWDRGHIEIAGRKAKTAARSRKPVPSSPSSSKRSRKMKVRVPNQRATSIFTSRFNFYLQV
jgi:hypothetical protein